MKIATHNFKFHADDVFAVAALFILLGKENCTVHRTRDIEEINSADFAVDVGDVYNPEQNRFDHHQEGGAEDRQNGIPYASFGLVWKAYGEKISGSKEASDVIDRILVQPIDAGDNGFSTFTRTVENVSPGLLGDVISLYRPTLKEPEDWDKRFLEAVDWAMWIIQREVKIQKDNTEVEKRIIEVYENSKNKKIIIFDKADAFDREITTRILFNFTEPIYAVLYRPNHDNWQIVAVSKERGSFETRKPFPEPWRAKTDEQFDLASGINGGVFCHKSGFMCVAKNFEAALELAEKSLNA